MNPHQPFNLKIDKLTHSIEHCSSGISFETEVLELKPADIPRLKKVVWLFDWEKEAREIGSKVYKLVVLTTPNIVQGLIILQDRHDHIFMSLIESSKTNRGTKKRYLGVPGNLVAFACKLSFELNYQGYVSFESKTQLIPHYQKTLNAHILFGNMMAIDTRAATKLVKQYFPQIL